MKLFFPVFIPDPTLKLSDPRRNVSDPVDRDLRSQSVPGPTLRNWMDDDSFYRDIHECRGSLAFTYEPYELKIRKGESHGI